MSIQLFVPSFRVEECLVEIRECLEKGWTGLGFKTLQFEKEWLDYTRLDHAHFLASNTVGLHLALELFRRRDGWQVDDEIITTPLTFVSTNHVIAQSGLKPVFADVDEYLCLSPDSLRARITPRTRAIMFVGIGGNIGRLAEVEAICRAHQLRLILDAAHMAGTRIAGQHIGRDADATVFSFQAVKNLPTADSGMICLADPELDAHARRLTWLGIDKDTYSRTNSEGAYKWLYEVDELGYKYHGNSIMAAIGLVQLRYLDRDNAYRRQLASWYRGSLDPRIETVKTAAECESSQHLFQIRVSNRDELMLALNENAVFPGVHYRDNTDYKLYASARGSCPNAARASAEIISLPLHMKLGRQDVELVSGLVNRYAK